MCSSQRPENGADSEPVEEVEDPPLEGLPPAHKGMVEHFVKQAMGPMATPSQIASQVSEVLMADALGRAIHAVRYPGGALDMARCVRVTREGIIEPVPYGYDDRKPDGYACDCESIALTLVGMMKSQSIIEDVKDPARVRPS